MFLLAQASKENHWPTEADTAQFFRHIRGISVGRVQDFSREVITNKFIWP